MKHGVLSTDINWTPMTSKSTSVLPPSKDSWERIRKWYGNGYQTNSVKTTVRPADIVCFQWGANFLTNCEDIWQYVDDIDHLKQSSYPFSRRHYTKQFRIGLATYWNVVRSWKNVLLQDNRTTLTPQLINQTHRPRSGSKIHKKSCVSSPVYHQVMTKTELHSYGE